jgi:hypothetical protein
MTWKRCFPHGLRQVPNEGMIMSTQMVRSKETKMVHDTATARNIAKHVLPSHPANCMMVSTAVDVTIGFMRLALDGKSSTRVKFWWTTREKLHMLRLK